MQIIIDTRHLTKPKPSGVGQYTLELLKALFVLDKKNEYLLLSSGSKKARANLPNFNFSNVKNFHLNLPNRLLNAALIATNRPKFDELITNKIAGDKKSLFFFPNLNIISLTPKTPYVLTLHDLSFEIFPELYNYKDRLWHSFCQARKLAQNAQAIIVPSKAAAHDVNFIFGIPHEKIFTVPHGIDPRFSPKIEPQDFGVKSRYRLPKKFALFIGTQEPRKNITLMLEALQKYRHTTGDDLHLVLVGKLGLSKLRTWHYPSPKNVTHLGYIRPQDLPALYRLASVTLFPSLYEGFGLPIIESMASGTPVITSKTSSMPEVGGQAAIYISPYNSNDLAKALHELFNSPKLQKQKITAGLKQSKNFNWQKTAEETLKIFNNLSI